MWESAQTSTLLMNYYSRRRNLAWVSCSLSTKKREYVTYSKNHTNIIVIFLQKAVERVSMWWNTKFDLRKGAVYMCTIRHLFSPIFSRFVFCWTYQNWPAMSSSSLDPPVAENRGGGGGQEAAEAEEDVPRRKLNWLLVPPVLTSALIIYLPICCYLQGLIQGGHFHYLLPLVSDTGNFVPESGSFSFYITIIGFLCK